MRTLLRAGVTVVLCVVAGGVGALVLADPRGRSALAWAYRWGTSHTPSLLTDSARVEPGGKVSPADSFPLFSSAGFEAGGFATADRYTGPIANRGSIEELRAAVKVRAERGIADLSARLRALPAGSPDRAFLTFQMHATMGLLWMYAGKFDEAAAWTQRALAESKGIGVPPALRANIEALLGVIHLRRGETENCMECQGPSSCIFPIAADAVHQRPSGSREALRYFREYLDQRPDDLGVRWLLNIAYMTLGEYPAEVPPDQLIGLEPFRSAIDVGRFENVAVRAGLTARGANMAGGSVFDDFTGDGLPDVLTSSFDTDLGASLFVNRGDGTFDDRSASSGLTAQPLAVNTSQADFDNDGHLDVLLVRGGWEKPARLSLLRNKGAGVFDDVTIASGLAEPIASHSGAWGDFDNDGKVDLFVCGEYGTSNGDGIYGGESTLSLSDPRNRCRLYRNQGDGTFVNVAAQAGVTNERFAKGAAWGDHDGDGLLDLYVANFGGGNRLYRNRGDGTFEDVAPRLGVTEPEKSFSCWFWDFDNDGRLDVFVNDYAGDLQNAVASALGQPVTVKSRPRLYRNLGPGGFRDVAREAGLDRVLLAMGSNFGDIDNDGFLDFYLGTGLPGYSALLPNVMFKNVDGRRFADVTTSSGTGHLQKGHGVSFADWDGDGDLDLFVETGGAVPGDRAYNQLFQNPGHGRHWLEVKLVGTTTNHAALGARLQVEIVQPDGARRSIYRQIGGGSSYGGNSLIESIGLGEASSVAALTVAWPASRSRQTFRNIAADQMIEVTEGAGSPRTVRAPHRLAGF